MVHGKVTLASGKEADYYVDLRRVTLHHEAAPLIGHLLLDLLEEEGLGTAEIDAVGGLTLGAAPVAGWFSNQWRTSRQPPGIFS